MPKKLHVVMIVSSDNEDEKENFRRQLLRIFRKKNYLVTEILMNTILSREIPESIKWIKKGKLVPDDLVMPIAIRVIREARGNVVIHDGFPRTNSQVTEFLKAVQGEKVIILELNTSQDVLLEREENCAVAILKKQGIPSIVLDGKKMDEEYIARCLSIVIS